jgi:hypothetical protein
VKQLPGINAIDEATPLQRAQLLAALSVGSEIIRLRRLIHELDLGTEFASRPTHEIRP